MQKPYYILCIILLFLLSACGSNQQASDTGSISFKLQLSRPTATSRAAAATSADICIDYGITTINVNVVTSSGAAVAAENWSCSAHEGTVTNVPAGANYTVKLEGVDSNDTVAWTGEKTDISITGGSTTDAGIITMTYVGSDTTPPTVTSTNPSDGAANVPVTILITATLNEEMAISSLNTVTFTVKNGPTPVNGSVTYDSNTKKAIFIPPGNLSYSTTYTATITAGVEDMAGNNMQSDATWSFTTEDPPTTMPSAPTGVNATAGNEQVTITWDAVAGATSYNIYWSTNAGVTKTTETNIQSATSPYIQSGLTNGTTYYYVVTAVNSSGESDESSEVSSTPSTTADTTPPTGSVIINSKAIYTTSSTVALTLSATDTSGVAQMCIRNTNTCTSWETYTTSRFWTLLTGDGTRFVYAWFKDSVGNSNSSPYIASIILDTTPPTDGTLTATAGDDQVSLNWSGFYDTTSGLSGYRLAYSTSGTIDTCSSGTQIYSGSDTTYIHTGLINGVTYYYRVCAIDNAGNVSVGDASSTMPTSLPLWTRTYNGSANSADMGYSIAVDNNDNVFVAGFTATISNGNDIWIQKYNKQGDTLWTRTYNGDANTNDEAWDIAVDGSGNIYVIGYTTTVGKGTDIWVRKYDTDGNMMWTQTHDGVSNGNEGGASIVVDSLGNVYVTGQEYVAGQGANIWIRKYDQTRNILWTRTYNGTLDGGDWGHGIVIDNLGNVYIVASENDNGKTYDVTIKKLDTDGNLLWTNTLSEIFQSGGAGGMGIANDRSGNVYIATKYITGQENILVNKYDTNGNSIWSKTVSGANCGNEGIVVDDTGNVYITGWDNPSIQGDENILVMKYDTTGNLLWAHTFNGVSNGTDEGHGIAVGNKGNVYVSGFESASGQSYNVWVRVYGADGTAPPEAGFTPSGTMTNAIYIHQATRLADGRVLVTGGVGISGAMDSAEIYDSSTGTFSQTGNMNMPRFSHTATLLSNGKVLIAGGRNNTGVNNASSYLSSAELYDPVTGTFSYTGGMSISRQVHTATLLQNGKVLITGGAIDWNTSGGVATDIAEIYDPTTGTFSRTGNLLKGNFFHTATLLDNGKVLISGGINSSAYVTDELYDPSVGTFTATGSMSRRRYYHAATKLSDGKILITGGGDGTTASLQTAEVYDPSTGTYSLVGNMNNRRNYHTSTLLSNGKVLITGGLDETGGNIVLNSAEIYDPAAGTFSTTMNMADKRYLQTATPLIDGTVLIVGGDSGSGYLKSSELYFPRLP